MASAEVSLNRRRFLARAGQMVALAGSGILIPASADAETIAPPAVDLWPKNNDIRQIWIKRGSTGEQAVLRYYDGLSLNMRAYNGACTILRDVQANSVANIDIQLLDLMFVMQKWLVSWGIDMPLIINSGFRTASTNGRTEGAAKNSMHLRGRAADIRMNGIPSDYLGRLASVFKKGGVGFYPSAGFVHIDTGSVRYWNKNSNQRQVG